LTGKIKLWVITDSRYGELTTIHKEFPLLDNGLENPQFDLLLKCTEEKFQRMTMTPTREAFWRKKKEWYDVMKAKEAKARPKLLKALGYDMSELEVMELLGVDAAPGGMSPTAGEISVGDIIE
jgi:hypothetical protein